MEKVRLGVIGCGGMGLLHIKVIKELSSCVLAAVADCNEEVAKKTGLEHNVKGFGDYNELINSKLVDAVIVATPHYFHPEAGIEAFKKGLHVLSEKPVAVSVSEGDRFLKAAKKSRKVFSVMYQSRSTPAIRAAREIIKNGKLGEIRRTLMSEPNYRSQAYYDSAGWRGTWKGEGGGVLMNQAPHGIDVFMLLGGLPAKVTAKTRTRMHKIEVEDEAAALLEYANGAWGYYYTSTCDDSKATRIEIYGDRGKLIYFDGELKFFTVNPPVSEHNAANKDMWGSPEVKEEKVELPAAETGNKEIIRNFCAAIQGKEELLSPGEEGMRSLEFINALILSGKTGKPVDIPVNRLKYDRMLEGLKKNSKDRIVKEVKRVSDPKQ